MIKYIVEARSASMGETALDANATAKNQQFRSSRSLA